MAIAIGADRLDATEHHRGLMLVVAASSAVKIVGFVIVGVFVTWGAYRGIGDLTQKITDARRVAAIIDCPPSVSMWLVLGTASVAATLVLPRQFHVSIVENRSEQDTRSATWAVPFYAFVICLLRHADRGRGPAPPIRRERSTGTSRSSLCRSGPAHPS